MPLVKLCTFAGCPAYAEEGRTRCVNHPDVQRGPTYRSSEREAIYSTRRWRATAALVKKRDDYTCQVCGYVGWERDNWMVADHVEGVLEVDDPFDPDGCQTLCRRCSGEKDGPRSADGRF